MNRQVVKWASGATVFIGLVVWISNAAIRLNKIEEKAGEVPDIKREIRVITLYLKLVDPANYEKAKELAK
jgi:hypothetical protein